MFDLGKKKFNKTSFKANFAWNSRKFCDKQKKIKKIIKKLKRRNQPRKVKSISPINITAGSAADERTKVKLILFKSWKLSIAYKHVNEWFIFP